MLTSLSSIVPTRDRQVATEKIPGGVISVWVLNYVYTGTALQVCMYRKRMYIQLRQNVFTDVYSCVYTSISSSSLYVQGAYVYTATAKCIYRCLQLCIYRYQLFRCACTGSGHGKMYTQMYLQIKRRKKRRI